MDEVVKSDALKEAAEQKAAPGGEGASGGAPAGDQKPADK